jgi:hypothetical protein
MMTKKWLENAEFVLLCVLAVALPTLEAPKNLALASIFVLWLTRWLVFKPYNLRCPDALEVNLLWLLLAATVSTAVNWPSLGQLKGVKDTLLGIIVYLAIFHGNLSPLRRYLLAAMVAFGVVIGLVWAGIDVLRGTRRYLEFNSAGVVTQSSIYLGVALVMSFGIALAGASRDTVRPESGLSRTLWWITTFVMLLGLIAMASRGAILAVATVCLIIFMLHRSPKVMLGGLFALVIAFCIIQMLPSQFNSARFLEKTQQLAQTGQIDLNDGVRFDMWRIGIAQFTQGGSPIFGIGPRNFPTIAPSTLAFDTPLTYNYDRLDHAHNLFITKLVEEGIFGLAALLFLFGQVSVSLFRDWRTRKRLDWQWYGALGAVVVPSAAGLFNTPWYREHALLAMLLFGLYFSSRSD